MTPRQFAKLVAPLIGLPVARTWRGAGSAIFLELGRLSVGDIGNQRRGQASLMIEWSWRIEAPRSILAGSWSTERKISSGLKALTRRRVRSIALSGRLPELSVALSGSRWLHSFMTAEGQPEWTIFLGDGSWLAVERGILVHDGDQEWRRSR